MYILRTEKQGGGKLMFMPFEIVSICVWLWYILRNMSVNLLVGRGPCARGIYIETCLTAAYSQLHK